MAHFKEPHGPRAAQLADTARDPMAKELPRRPPDATPYAELVCCTNFSFLRGASHAEELVRRAVELGLTALAITDWHSLALKRPWRSPARRPRQRFPTRP
jgi:hypothetical protein